MLVTPINTLIAYAGHIAWRDWFDTRKLYDTLSPTELSLYIRLKGLIERSMPRKSDLARKLQAEIENHSRTGIYYPKLVDVTAYLFLYAAGGSMAGLPNIASNIACMGEKAIAYKANLQSKLPAGYGL